MNEELKKNIGKKCRILETWRGLKKGDICEIKGCDRNSYHVYTKDKSSENVMYTHEIEIIEDTPDTKLEINKEQTFNGDSHSTVTTVKKNKLMDKLKKIPNTLKRIIDKDLQAMYKVSFINGDLAITEKGANELMNYLITIPSNKKALSDIAKEIIKEIKDNN